MSASPVEIIVGLPKFVIVSISGKKVLSPEAILKIGCIELRNFALSTSNGVEKKIIPNSFA